MEVGIDHYRVLGLPSGEEGTKPGRKDIIKAYRRKALELHPDKRRGDPNAHSKFQRLKYSYDILIDAEARHLFNVRIAKRQCISELDSKMRKILSDLEERERAVEKTVFVDREKVLKVSWRGGLKDYSVERLRELLKMLLYDRRRREVSRLFP